MIHADPDVELALIRLNDALCQWERATGIEAALILRDSNGYGHRSLSGKPITITGYTDGELLALIDRARAERGGGA